MPRRRPTRARIDLDRLRDRFADQAVAWGVGVRKRRLEVGLTQDQLAELVGCTLQTISKVELGEIVPRDYLKAAIALRLLKEVDDLFPWPTRESLERAA